MKSLEGLARHLFTTYAQKSGAKADWNYLSDSRKLAWMQDVLLLADHFMTNLKAEMKPIPNGSKASTVYEAGFYEGVRSERTSFTLLVEDTHNKLLNEYQDFKERTNK